MSEKQRLARITEAFACSICHETFRAPVQLRCGHMFCSECIRRHLATTASCPYPQCKAAATTAMIIPLRMLDAALDTVRTENVSKSMRRAPAKAELGRLVFLDKKGSAARTRILDRLRENHLPLKGDLDVLAKRDKEFVIKWNANLDSATPRSRQAIADVVIKEERYRAAEARKRANERENISQKLFFSVKHETKKDITDCNAPVEGDDFETLIRKTQERKRLQKQAFAEQVSSNVTDPPLMRTSQDVEVSHKEPRTHQDKLANTAEGRVDAPLVINIDSDNDFDVPPTPPSEPPSPLNLSSPGQQTTTGQEPVLGKRKQPEPELNDAEKENRLKASVAMSKDIANGSNTRVAKELEILEVMQDSPNAEDPSTKATGNENNIHSSSCVQKRPRSPRNLTNEDNDHNRNGNALSLCSTMEKDRGVVGNEVKGVVTDGQHNMSTVDPDSEITPQKAIRRVGIHVASGGVPPKFPTPSSSAASTGGGHSQNPRVNPDPMPTQSQSSFGGCPAIQRESEGNREHPTQGGVGLSRPASTVPSAAGIPLSPEVQQRIEQSKRIAMQKKRQFLERMSKSAMRQPNFQGI